MKLDFGYSRKQKMPCSDKARPFLSMIALLCCQFKWSVSRDPQTLNAIGEYVAQRTRYDCLQFQDSAEARMSLRGPLTIPATFATNLGGDCNLIARQCVMLFLPDHVLSSCLPLSSSPNFQPSLSKGQRQTSFAVMLSNASEPDIRAMLGRGAAFVFNSRGDTIEVHER